MSSDLKISDKGNGILIIEDSDLSLKCDTNRRIYVKKNNGMTYKYVFTGVFTPQNMTKEQKKSYLYNLHGLCVQIKNNKNDYEDNKNEEND